MQSALRLGHRTKNQPQLNYQQASEVLMANTSGTAAFIAPMFKNPLKFTNFRGEQVAQQTPNVPFSESYVKLWRR